MTITSGAEVAAVYYSKNAHTVFVRVGLRVCYLFISLVSFVPLKHGIFVFMLVVTGGIRLCLFSSVGLWVNVG